jgi:hypothetical protein
LFVNAAAAIIEPAPDEARTQRQLAMLQELAEIGMRLARGLESEAFAPAEEPRPPSRFGGGDLGLIFSRIARAVRQTLALEARLAGEIETARVEHVRAATDARRRQVRGYVVEAIEADAVEHGKTGLDVEWLLGDLDERLDDGDYDAALEAAPIGDLVARICADLGVTPDWSLWEDEAWAIAYEKSRPPDNQPAAEHWPSPPGANPDTGQPPPDSS